MVDGTPEPHARSDGRGRRAERATVRIESSVARHARHARDARDARARGAGVARARDREKGRSGPDEGTSVPRDARRACVR